MKRTAVVFGVLLATMSLGIRDACAGVVYGSVDMVPAVQGDALSARIDIACPANPQHYSTELTIPGSYTLNVIESGKCKLHLHYGNASASIDVFPVKAAVRYDLIVQMSKGKLVLKRR